MRRASAGWRRSTPCSMRIVLTLVAFDGIMALQPHWFSNLLGGFYFMGSFLGAHMLLALHDDLRRLAPRRRRPRLAQAAARSRQALLRLHRVLDLSHVGPVPGDLVRQHAGGDRASSSPGSGDTGCRSAGRGASACSSFRSSACSAWRPRRRAPVFGFFATVSLVALWLERYLLVDAVGDGAARAP